MSDDIRAKAQAVLYRLQTNAPVPLYANAEALARHVLDTEHRLDVALWGALQSREEMREWLGSEETLELVRDAIWHTGGYVDARVILAALIAAMPGADQ